MNWDALGAIAELLGAAGVLASLLYLGTQIRQNTRWLKQQAFQQGTNEVRQWAAGFGQSPETSALFIKGQSDYDSLDPTERWQFTMLVFQLCSIWEVYRRYDDEEMLGLLGSAEVSIRVWVDQGWFPGWWRQWGWMCPPGFQRFAADLIEKRLAERASAGS